MPSVELNRERIALGAVGLVATAAVLPGARRYALWQDEVASARAIVEPTPVGLLHHVARTESTPPLWYALAWIVHRCGLAIVDVRLLSVAAATALAVATVMVGRLVAPEWAALLAGLAVALGYQFDFHGRELRTYELAALLTVLLALAALRGDSALLTTVVAAGSLTHYFFVFAATAVVCWRRSTWRAVALGLVPLALWSPFFVRQYEHHGYSFIGPFNAHAVVGTYWRTFARGQTPVLPVLLAAAVVAGAFVVARSSEAGRLCALLAVGPVAVAALLWLVGVDVYDVRNVIGSGPFAAVAVAALVARAPRTIAPVVASVLLGLLALGFARTAGVAPVAYDKIAAELVAAGWQPRDRIVVCGDVYAFWGPLEWYLPNHPRFLAQRSSRSRAEFVVGTQPGCRRMLVVAGA